MSIALPPDLAQFVEAEVAKGRYGSEDELLSDAVRLLRARRLHELRQEIQRGLEGVQRDDAIEIDGDEELARFFDEIVAEVESELSAEGGRQ